MYPTLPGEEILTANTTGLRRSLLTRTSVEDFTRRSRRLILVVISVHQAKEARSHAKKAGAVGRVTPAQSVDVGAASSVVRASTPATTGNVAKNPALNAIAAI